MPVNILWSFLFPPKGPKDILYITPRPRYFPKLTKDWRLTIIKDNNNYITDYRLLSRCLEKILVILQSAEVH